jgi:hypothetical protein
LTSCFYDNNPGVTAGTTGTAATSSEPATTTAPAQTSSTAPADTTADPPEPTTITTTTTTTAPTTGGPDSTTIDPTTSACVEHTWYLDADGDGVGADASSTLACDVPPGYVPIAGDCDPIAPDVAPGLPELCDGKDNDCDLGIDEYAPDTATCAGCTTIVMGARVFHLCSNSLTWTAAQAACQLYGATTHLASIHGQAEHDAVVAAISASDPAADWWIGLNDLTSEGTFTWIDATSVDYLKWRDMEPNDYMAGEDCAEYSPGTFEWNDASCDIPFYYICAGPQ